MFHLETIHNCHAGFQLPGSLLPEVERKLMMNSPFSRAAEPKGTCWNPCGAEYLGSENAAYIFSAGNWVFLCVTLILKNYIHWVSKTSEIIQKMSAWDNICSVSLNSADSSGFYIQKGAAPLSSAWTDAIRKLRQALPQAQFIIVVPVCVQIIFKIVGKEYWWKSNRRLLNISIFYKVFSL